MATLMQQKENRLGRPGRKEKHHLATVFENNRESQICRFCGRSITIFGSGSHIKFTLKFTVTEGTILVRNVFQCDQKFDMFLIEANLICILKYISYVPDVYWRKHDIYLNIHDILKYT